ncbi:helix-turn-helix transcriptional regulator [Lachnospiraceae bacterium MD308]|nr:helix-turn-helix transcriptional regulator [Lachnospiraceae bacterium MD308]
MLRWWHLYNFDSIIQTEKQKERLFKMTFGEKLKGLRKEKGYSQEELAGLLEVSRQAVSK